MAKHAISILGGTDVTCVERCLCKGIELHQGARDIERLRRPLFTGLTELPGSQALVSESLAPLKRLCGWSQIGGDRKIDSPELLDRIRKTLVSRGRHWQWEDKIVGHSRRSELRQGFIDMGYLQTV